MGSDFMELRHPTKPSPIVHRLLAQSLQHTIAAEISFTTCLFDPAVLWDVNATFLLQIVFPMMRLASISKTMEEAPMMCLLDIQTQTLLTFYPREEQQWSVEVRGDPQFWEQVVTVYQQWLSLRQPIVTDYCLEVDEQGKQMFTLPSVADQRLATLWVLSEAEGEMVEGV